MLCMRCGRDVGEKIGLCDSCEEATAAAPQAPDDGLTVEEKLAATRKTHRRTNEAPISEDPLNFESGFQVSLTNPYFLGGGFAIIFLVALIGFIIMGKALGTAAFLALACSIFLISLAGWLFLWTTFFSVNPVVAIASLFVPIAAYAVVASHPETRKPFAVHVAAAFALATLLTVGGSKLRSEAFSELGIFSYHNPPEAFYDEYQHEPIYYHQGER